MINRWTAIGLSMVALAITTAAICVDGAREQVRRWQERRARRRAWADEVRRRRKEQGR